MLQQQRKCCKREKRRTLWHVNNSRKVIKNKESKKGMQKVLYTYISSNRSNNSYMLWC